MSLTVFSFEAPEQVRGSSVHASTPSSSGGRGVLGCLLSKCCLNVFGSGICDYRERERERQSNLTLYSIYSNSINNFHLNTNQFVYQLTPPAVIQIIIIQ